MSKHLNIPTLKKKKFFYEKPLPFSNNQSFSPNFKLLFCIEV